MQLEHTMKDILLIVVILFVSGIVFFYLAGFLDLIHYDRKD